VQWQLLKASIQGFQKRTFLGRVERIL